MKTTLKKQEIRVPLVQVDSVGRHSVCFSQVPAKLSHDIPANAVINSSICIFYFSASPPSLTSAYWADLLIRLCALTSFCEALLSVELN